MPVSVFWYLENRIIAVQLIGIVSSDEMVEGNARQLEMFAEGTAPVHVMVDFSQVDTMPMDIKQGIQSSSFFREQKLGWVTAFAIPSRAMKFVGSVVAQAMRTRLRIFDTQEECLAFLHDQDSSL